jgi:hypothetical protein
MIKASNVIASVEPIKLTDVRTLLTDIAPIIETFLGSIPVLQKPQMAKRSLR